jgi:hypothetical protein
MFNLGTKTVVLNSNANVTEANGVISIAGGTAIPTVAAAGRQGEFLLQNAVAGVYTITQLHLMTILKHLTWYSLRKSIV